MKLLTALASVLVLSTQPATAHHMSDRVELDLAIAHTVRNVHMPNVRGSCGYAKDVEKYALRLGDRNGLEFAYKVFEKFNCN